MTNPDARPRRAVAIAEAPVATPAAPQSVGPPAHGATNRRRYLAAWAVLLLGLLLTAVATRYMKASVEQSAELAFAGRCNEVQQVITNRLDDHARLLLSGAALFEATETVTRETWRTFTQAQQFNQQLPGIQGIGFSLLISPSELPRHLQDIRREGFPEYNVRPAGTRELYSSIIYLEPFSGRNLRAFGYDMFAEPVRRAAMERARDTDAAAISGKVELVQETDTGVQAGTLMYVPVYRHGLPIASVAQRRIAIAGWVYSPYRMTDLLKGILNPIGLDRASCLRLKVFDGPPSPHRLLYENVPLENENLWPEQDFTRQMPIEFNGHYWTLYFTQTSGGIFTAAYTKVWITLCSGTLISVLLFALGRVLLNTRAKAQRLADALTFDLQQSEEALRQATDRLSLAVSAGGVGIWDYDVIHNRLAWDDQMFRLYGITAEQFSGAYAAWQAGIHPEDRQRGDHAIQMALRGDQAFDIDFRVLWPDGTIRYIRGLASVQRDAAGHPLRMIGTNWDITAQKQAEANITRQAGLINSLLDSIPDLIFFKDVTGLYLGCNPAFAEFVGRSRDAIVGKTDYELFGREIADSFREHDQRMLALLEARHNEETITYPDGRQRLLDTLKTPYWGPDEKLIGILGISRDITARQQAEAALRESEANFRTFFETVTDMIMVATPAGRLLFANTAVTRTLGYSAEQLTGMQLLDLHPAEQRTEAAAVFAAMFRGERENCPLPLERRDGGLVPVETRVWFGQWNGANCLFGICKNLSAEQEATQRFERLFRHNPTLMALSTLPDRRFSDVNDTFLNTLGYARDEVIGKTAAELALFPHPEQLAALVNQLQTHEHLADVELQVRHRDGKLLSGLFSGEKIGSQGREYFLTVMVDITARQQAEEALRQTANRLPLAASLFATSGISKAPG
ncbi:MAG: CHASE domain-containing protein, partial [bacterium]